MSDDSSNCENELYSKVCRDIEDRPVWGQADSLGQYARRRGQRP
jgi:hypothetical protein